MTTAIRAAMREYSAAVAPRSARARCSNRPRRRSQGRVMTIVGTASTGSDRGGDVVEQVAEVGAQQGHGRDDDDGDQRDHQAVLNGGGTTLTAQDVGGLELELHEKRH